MDVAVSKKKTVKTGARKRRGQYPVKRTINFATQGEKKMRLGLAIPGIILILIAAAAFSKFLVVDRMNEVYRAQAEVRRLQTRLDEGYEELGGFDDLSEMYAHYTYSGFTAEELSRADRVEVLKLFERLILPFADVSAWKLTGNELSVNMVAESLQQVNLIVQQLEKEDMVDFCSVSTAKNDRIKTDSDEVKALVVVYLNAETGGK